MPNHKPTCQRCSISDYEWIDMIKWIAGLAWSCREKREDINNECASAFSPVVYEYAHDELIRILKEMTWSWRRINK